MEDTTGNLHLSRPKRCFTSTDSKDQPCKLRRGNQSQRMIEVDPEAAEVLIPGSTSTVAIASEISTTPAISPPFSSRNIKGRSSNPVQHQNPPSLAKSNAQERISSASSIDLCDPSHRNQPHSPKSHSQVEPVSIKPLCPYSSGFLQKQQDQCSQANVALLSQGESSILEHTQALPDNDTVLRHSKEDQSNDMCNFLDESENHLMSYAPGSQNILNLPNSILLHIFHYLTIPEILRSVALVCNKWYELSKDPSLWRHLCFQDLTNMNITDDILDKVTSYSNSVVHLDLSNTMGFTTQGISLVLKKCRRLVYLSLKGNCCLPDSTFQLIAENLPELEELYLDDCFSVTSKTMSQIFINCPRLTHVSLSCHLNSEAVETLATHCQRLKLINISHCEAVQELSIMLQKCKQLESINLSNCPVTDSHLKHLTNLTNLKHIYLNSVNMTSTAAKEIAKNCLKLQTMSLCFNDCVDDDCITAVVRYARNLKVLKCIRCGITDIGMTAIGKNCQNLQKLDVSFCNNISNVGVRYVSSKCAKLCFLGLFYCENVEPEFLFELEKIFPNIHFYCFDLEYNRLIKRANEQGYL